MRIQCPGFQNVALDQEDDNNEVVPGAWRDGDNMQDMDNIVGGN